MFFFNLLTDNPDPLQSTHPISLPRHHRYLPTLYGGLAHAPIILRYLVRNIDDALDVPLCQNPSAQLGSLTQWRPLSQTQVSGRAAFDLLQAHSLIK